MLNNEINDNLYIEYFKILQNTITRMAQNSFLIKAWSITIIAGISVLTFSFINTLIFAVLIGVIIVFWIMDSYYLRLEKLYRKLYEKVVNIFNTPSMKTQIRLFDMKYESFTNQVHTIPRIMFSKAEGLFYNTLILAMCFLIVINIFF